MFKGERLNRYSSMVIDSVRRSLNAKQEQTTEVNIFAKSVDFPYVSVTLWNFPHQKYPQLALNWGSPSDILTDISRGLIWNQAISFGLSNFFMLVWYWRTAVFLMTEQEWWEIKPIWDEMRRGERVSFQTNTLFVKYSSPISLYLEIQFSNIFSLNYWLLP